MPVVIASRRGIVPGVPHVYTEDIVYLLDQQRIHTGIKLGKVLEAAQKVVKLVDHPTDFYLLRVEM